ncbi:MAG: hypothetical protein K0S29_272 [Gammaproteobacteria bacterium]|jgi:YggT family protein|nr:hypothetical protein [Gammaproteobacteria bacterium]
MNNTAIQALLFLINSVFSLYIMAVMLRFLLQWAKADFYNPFCQFLIKITNPLLLPLRKIIPGWFGLDISALVLMLALQILNIVLIELIVNIPINALIVVPALLKLLYMLLNLYFYMILARAILSWVNPYQNSPMQILLVQLSEPVLMPIRRIIKPIHGFDLSPIAAMILIQVLLILLR